MSTATDTPTAHGLRALLPPSSGMDRLYSLIRNLDDLDRMGEYLAMAGPWKGINPAAAKTIILFGMGESLGLFEFWRRYHIVDGVPMKRAIRIAADFRSLGGRYVIIEQSATRAAATFTWEGQTIERALTWDEALAAGWPQKPKEQGKLKDVWAKHPAKMLWWRLMSSTVDLLAPEITGGIAQEEPDASELDGVAAPVTAAPGSVAAGIASALQAEAAATDPAAAVTVPAIAAPAAPAPEVPPVAATPPPPAKKAKAAAAAPAPAPAAEPTPAAPAAPATEPCFPTLPNVDQAKNPGNMAISGIPLSQINVVTLRSFLAATPAPAFAAILATGKITDAMLADFKAEVAKVDALGDVERASDDARRLNATKAWKDAAAAKAATKPA